MRACSWIVGCLLFWTASAVDPPEYDVLPAPVPPPFEGRIGTRTNESKPYWPPPMVPPEGAPNVVIILIDDAGKVAVAKLLRHSDIVCILTKMLLLPFSCLLSQALDLRVPLAALSPPLTSTPLPREVSGTYDSAKNSMFPLCNISLPLPL